MDFKTIIKTEKLSKVFGLGDAQVYALKSVNLEIRENEFVAIMGPSGSGKSTLMNILGCLDRPTSGHYWLAGEDVSGMDKNKLAIIRNQRLGFIFQSFNLLPQTSALENVMLPLLYDHRGSNSEAANRVKALKALDAVSLADRVNHKSNQLSGGQIQRVAIARALVNDPVLILADEPTGNLDTKASQEILSLLSELHQKGSTIVMVTHSDEIAGYAQREIRFRDGQIESDVPNAVPFPQPIHMEVEYACQ